MQENVGQRWRTTFEVSPFRGVSYTIIKMHLTSVLLKKVKTKYVMVLLRSTGSNHSITSFRERTGDKKELIFFDPLIHMECVYKEEKKIKGVKQNVRISKTYNEDTYGIIPQELLESVSKTVSNATEKDKKKTKP